MASSTRRIALSPQSNPTATYLVLVDLLLRARGNVSVIIAEATSRANESTD
jgi:hypothetical protein